MFKEFTEAGWPLCPVCEEDELYSILMLNYHGEGERPSISQCLAGEMRCYRCNWTSFDLRSAIERLQWPSELEER